MDEQHLPKDPIQWVKDLEKTWQAMDAEKASEGYTEDAVMIFGCDPAPIRRKCYAKAKRMV